MELKHYEDTQYSIDYCPSLEEFIRDEIELSKAQRAKLIELFGSDIDIVKGVIFDNREDFVKYVEEVSNGWTPPEFSTGCFYNNEIQSYITTPSVNSHDIITHEQTHIFINKLLYNPYHLNRLRWFDEAFACYFDKRWTKRTHEFLKDSFNNYLIYNTDIDLNILNHEIPQQYRGNKAYTMFMFVGQYIFETGKEREIIELMKTDPEKVQELGTHILKDAVDYFGTQFGQENN